jgi:lauroyl/myristoyl acyltransferase
MPFPDKWLQKLARLIGYLDKIIFRERIHKRFRKNLRIAYPDKSDDVLNKIVDRTVNSFILNALMIGKYMTTPAAKINKKVRVRNYELVEEMVGKQPFIVVTPHFDLTLVTMKMILKLFKIPMMLPVRPIINKKFHDEIMPIINEPNFTRITTGGALGQLEEFMAKNAAIMIAIDSVSTAKYKHKVKFFDEDFDVSTGLFWLSEKYNLPVVTAYSLLDSDGSIYLNFYDKEYLKNTPEAIQAYIDKLEEIIHRYPGRWNIPDDFWPTSTEPK